MKRSPLLLALLLTLVAGTCAWPQSQQQRRKIIFNEDCSGPGGSNMQTLLVLLQSPQVELLGVTVVSGDQWRDEEVAHALRLLEIVGRTDIPVFRGAAFPLLRTHDEAQHWQARYGKMAYSGAWDARWFHDPFVVPKLAEGEPGIKARDEDAVHFLIRSVREHPGEVTIYEGGPMTNLALAIGADPEFPKLAQQLIFMGGSLNPVTTDAEFTNNPRHEFNFWFDPEAAEIVLRAPWKKIVCTPVDVSIKTRLTPEMVKRIDASGTPAGRYLARYFLRGDGNDYMWDELAAAAWIDPSLITKSQTLYMGVDISQGPSYGNTLTWNDRDKPVLARVPVEIQIDLDSSKFNDMFVRLMSAPASH